MMCYIHILIGKWIQKRVLLPKPSEREKNPKYARATSEGPRNTSVTEAGSNLNGGTTSRGPRTGQGLGQGCSYTPGLARCPHRVRTWSAFQGDSEQDLVPTLV